MLKRTAYFPGFGVRELASEENEPSENCRRTFMTTCYALNLRGVPYCRACEHLYRVLHGDFPSSKPPQREDDVPASVQLCIMLIVVTLSLAPLFVCGPFCL